MSANERQIGGDHYRATAAHNAGEQHWDRQWRLGGRGYFIGQITRYAERYHLKNGLQDLDKIVHYTEKLKELEQAWIEGRGPPPGDAGNAKLRGVGYADDPNPYTEGTTDLGNGYTRTVGTADVPGLGATLQFTYERRKPVEPTVPLPGEEHVVNGEEGMIGVLARYVDRLKHLKKGRRVNLPSPDYRSVGVYSPQWKRIGNVLFWEFRGVVFAVKFDGDKGEPQCYANSTGIPNYSPRLAEAKTNEPVTEPVPDGSGSDGGESKGGRRPTTE